MTSVRFALVSVLLLAVMPVSGRAQTNEPPLRRFEIAAGVGFLGGAALGDADADLRSSTSSDPYRLFATSSRQLGATMLDLRAGFDLSRRIGLEGRMLF